MYALTLNNILSWKLGSMQYPLFFEYMKDYRFYFTNLYDRTGLYYM